ncbi:MAG TPA: hypothetical protein VFM57_12620, partial [Thermoleophilaceae bacterium]|nr:hypothetical protein [Thermoleophilaceae bacterium]
MAAEAGLAAVEAGYVQVREEHPDLETMLRGYMAAAPFVRAARAAGQEAVRRLYPGLSGRSRSPTGIIGS